MKKVLFDIKDLSFSFAEKRVLNSLSLKIFEGDFISIIGPNGGGKTTFIKCLIGINTPPKKKIFFHDTPVENFSQKELASQISYVPQTTENIFPFTAKEFLLLSRYPHLSRFSSITNIDKEKVNEAFELTQTKHLENRYLNTLSGGEKQMIFIAAALAQGGNLILLDEPATFLDPKHEYEIYGILKKIHKQTGKTIVSVTHNINSAILYSDKVAIIKNGNIFYYGNATGITENNVLEKAYDKKFSFIKHPNCDKKIILPEVIG